MSFGLFGKVPQKRDFMSTGLPSDVLRPFETWLQSAVAASKSEIGQDWPDYYLVAPIWRVWLGRELFGSTCAGAVMPSVDKVGRYFPLAILYVADPDEDLPSPLEMPADWWYRAIEERLLSVLDRSDDADISGLLDGLPPPNGLAVAAPDEPAEAAKSPATATAPPPVPSPDVLDPAEPVAEPAALSPGTAKPPPSAPGVSAAGDTGDEPWALTLPTSLVVDPSSTMATTLPPDNAAVATMVRLGASAATAAPTPSVEVTDFDLPLAIEPAVSSADSEPPPIAEAPAPSSPPEPATPETTPSPPAAATEAPVPVGTPHPADPEIVRVVPSRLKASLIVAVKPGTPAGQAQTALRDLDQAHGSAGRCYWWRTDRDGGFLAFHASRGLPDPYFFSFMLGWGSN